MWGLSILLDALWRGRQVRFLYDAVLNATSKRTVDPLGLVARGSTWYLIAIRGGELRTYRVSRMRQAETLDRPASRPADFDIAAYWERSATEFREKLPQYRGSRLEEETPQGELVRVRLRFDAEAEVLQFALSFGADVELLEPAELRARVRDAARGMLAVYK